MRSPLTSVLVALRDDLLDVWTVLGSVPEPDPDPDDDRHLFGNPWADDLLPPGAIRRDLLARTYGCRMRPPRGRLDRGEYDPYRALTKRQRRRLASGGWLPRDGFAPDVLASFMDGDRAADEVCEWYLTRALAALAEPRPSYPMGDRDRFARRQGHRSYHALREARARTLGFPSYRAHRAARHANPDTVPTLAPPRETPMTDTVHQETPTLDTVLNGWTVIPPGTALRNLVIAADFADRRSKQTIPLDVLLGSKRPSRVIAEGVGRAIANLGSVHDSRRVEVCWWFAPDGEV
jgi:hypothetical protein